MCRSAHYSTDHIRSVVDELKPLRRVGGVGEMEGRRYRRKVGMEEGAKEGGMDGGRV